jgi:Flp pilus assembly protein TadG
MNGQTIQPTTRRRSTKVRRRDRKGLALSVELIVVLPVLLLVLVAMVEYGILLVSSQGISAAANVGARQAALPSSSKADVDAAVETALGGFIWQGRQETLVFVNGAKDNSVAPNTGLLDASTTGDEIQVTVSIDADEVTPDILRYIGLSLAGSQVTSTFITRRE